MQKRHTYLASFALTAALAAPMAAVITATPASAQDDRGFYDKDHKDYHKWDDHEQSAWGRFLAEKHRKEPEFAKANHKKQQEYWEWRHSHPD
jgi:hypothetical protein